MDSGDVDRWAASLARILFQIPEGVEVPPFKYREITERARVVVTRMISSEGDARRLHGLLVQSTRQDPVARPQPDGVGDPGS